MTDNRDGRPGRRDPAEHVRVADARRGAALAALTAVFGESVIAAIDAHSTTFGATTVARLVHVGIAAIALAGLALDRRGGVRAASVAFAMVAIPFAIVLGIAEIQSAPLGHARDELSWYKLVMLGIAFFAPAGPWFPALLTAELAVQAVTLWFVLGPDPRLSGEPWVTVAFAAIAVGMVISRIHRREAAARAERVLAQARALQRVTRLLLIVRDRANTPLQTIAFAGALLARRCPEQARVALAMEAAVARLRKLSRTLEHAGRWARRSAELSEGQRRRRWRALEL